jgi:hypothetical protein
LLQLAPGFGSQRSVGPEADDTAELALGYFATGC